MTKASNSRARTAIAAAVSTLAAVSIAEFDSKTLSESGVECKLIHPRTGLPSGAAVVVHGLDSERFRTAIAEQARKINDLRAEAAGAEVDDEAKKAFGLSLLASCTSGFVNLADENGEPLQYSHAAAVDFYARSPSAREQVDVFLMNRANFLKA